jgi:hypothetical protein
MHGFGIDTRFRERTLRYDKSSDESSNPGAQHVRSFHGHDVVSF